MRKFFIGIFLVTLVISQAVVGYTMTDNEREAQKYFEQANDEWKNGIHDAQRVLELYNRAIELNPNLADAYIGRSVVYMLGFHNMNDENRINARQDCERALQANPYSARAYRWRAYLNMRTDLDKALADANKAIELDSNYLDAYEMRAWIYKELKNYSLAIADYTYILEYPDLKNSSYMKYYDFDRMSDWAWYINWDQRISALYNQRGNAYYDNGEIDKSIDDYERALKLSPHNMWIGRPFQGKIEQVIAEKNLRNAFN